MSLLSKFTGVHISKHGVHIEPLKALGTALTVGSLGGFGPLAGAMSAIPGAGAVAGAAGKVKGALSAIPGAAGIGKAVASHGGIGGIAHSALDYAKGHPSEILAGLQVGNAASLGKKSNQYADNAMKAVNQSYMDRAGLRSAGIDEMLHPQALDMSGAGAIRKTNPYAIQPVSPPPGLQLARVA